MRLECHAVGILAAFISIPYSLWDMEMEGYVRTWCPCSVVALEHQDRHGGNNGVAVASCMLKSHGSELVCILQVNRSLYFHRIG